MSLDHPFYEELCRRKHPGARWRLVGDVVYYLGLVTAVAGFSAAVPALVAVLFDSEWGWLLAVGGIALAVGVAVNQLGSGLKRHAYRLAERDGITPASVWRSAGEEQGDA